MVALENFGSLKHFLPECLLMGGALLVLVLDMVWGARRRALYPWLGVGVLALAGLAALPGAGLRGEGLALFEQMFTLDGFTRVFRLFFVLVGALTLLMAARSRELRGAGGEFTGLTLIVVLGMILMAGAGNLVMAYLAMETVSLLSYTLVGSLRGNRRSHEAGLKYVIFGGVASGAMLYGFSWLFGLTGTLDLAAMGEAFRAGAAQPLPVFLALVLILVGLGFKMAAAPFHMWCPDVYEGAPVAVTAFLSVGPKAAGFALTLRILYTALAEPTGSGWLPIAGLPWPTLIAVMAVATMFIGNLSALWQDNLKRLMAYSSIAHAGYLLAGLVLLTPAGVTAIVFYLFAYLIMNFGAFMVIAAVAEESGSGGIDGIRGLWRRRPFLAVMMLIFLISLTGLPPAFGFIGKFYLFAALIEGGWLWLALLGLLNSVISLGYYMRIARVMLIDGTEDAAPAPTGAAPAPVLHPATGPAGVAAPAATPALSPLSVAIVGVLGVLTVLLGIYWEPLRLFAERGLALP
ncbi:NADH-quinone oxidoreductase subunit N [bacterium]|nr:NADH-quinone oxidoreductase subunit N [bacterium]